MKSRHTFMIGHAILWAVAIIASALLGGAPELNIYVLPALAFCALYIVGTGAAASPRQDPQA